MKTTLVLLAVLALAGTGCGKAKYMCASKQAEAKAMLSTINSSQKQYLQDNKKYAATMKDLNAPMDMARFYDYKIDSATATGFSATATGKDDMSGDVWKVDETGTAKAVTDKCSTM